MKGRVVIERNAVHGFAGLGVFPVLGTAGQTDKVGSAEGRGLGKEDAGQIAHAGLDDGHGLVRRALQVVGAACALALKASISRQVARIDSLRINQGSSEEWTAMEMAWEIASGAESPLNFQSGLRPKSRLYRSAEPAPSALHSENASTLRQGVAGNVFELWANVSALKSSGDSRYSS